MANQFSVTVSGNTVIVPSASVMLQSTSANETTVAFRGNGGVLYATASIADLVALANTGATQQVQLTVIRVNDSTQVNTIQMSFPVGGFIAHDSTINGSHAVVNYEGLRYYVSETQDAILDAANAGGGGGSTPTIEEVLTSGSDAGALPITNVDYISLSGSASINYVRNIGFVSGGVFTMRDTATDEIVRVVITNGAFVLTVD